jgi:hypothetical protein
MTNIRPQYQAHVTDRNSLHVKFTGILYRASAGPEQGFPYVVFPHREKPVFIAGFHVPS